MTAQSGSMTVIGPQGAQYPIVAIDHGREGKLLTMLDETGDTFSAYENQLREDGWTVNA